MKLTPAQRILLEDSPELLAEFIPDVKDGETGPKGDKGDQGEQGIQGEKGNDGEKGERGDVGPIGPQGEKGDRGTRGIEGEQGLKGDKGNDGKDGEDGKDAVITPEIIKPIVDESVLEGMKKIDGRIKAIDQRYHGAGLSKVSTDTTLTGNGTPSSPLHVVSSGGSAAGPVNAVQFNNPLGTFAGSASFTYDGVALTLASGKIIKGQYSNLAGSAFINPDGSAVFGTNSSFNNAGNLSVPAFKLTASPATGYVLTSDAAGNGTWSPASGGSPASPSGTLQWNNSGVFGALVDSVVDNTNNYVGFGNTPQARVHSFGKDTTIADPVGLAASLTLESLQGAPTDCPSLVYGPQSTSGSGTENPGYSGYTNNDSVDGYVLPYRIIDGIYWTGPVGFMGNVGLLSNPSGIDWNWALAVNGDGSGVDGYIINIIDITTGTNYTYDVGNTTSYADMNVGGTVTYQDFCSLGCFTASGQSFNFEPYNVFTSPSGFGFYASSSGGDFGVNEGYNNGSQFWVQHNLSGNSGAGWARVFLLDTIAGNSGETSLSTYYQRGAFSGPGSLPYSQHYGFLADGSTLNQSFAVYAEQTTPSVFFSSGFSTSSVFDPGDSQYYVINFSISSIGGGNTTRIVRQDGYHYDVAVYPFIEDAFGPSFLIGAVVTPVGLTNSAVIAQNSASAYDQSSALEVLSTGGAPTAAWFDNSTERLRMGYDPVSSTSFIKTANGSLVLRNSSNTVLTSFTPTSVVFNSNNSATYSYLIRTPNSNPIFAVFGSTDSIAIGPSANTTAWMNFAAGTTSKAQTNYATQASAPSSPGTGDMWFDGAGFRFKISTYLAHILQTGTASALSSGNFPVVDTVGNLRDSSLSLVGGFGGTVIQASLQFEAKQGIQLDSAKDLVMGSGSRITGNVGWTYIAKTANATLGNNEYIYNATSNSFNFTLPTAVGISGREYQIHNSGTGTTTILTTSSQTIDGNASAAITLTQYQSLTVASDGANWIITSRNVLTNTGTLLASSISSGAALTKTDDTNVTMTLGGTPSTALLVAASMTLGWTGTLSVARGGTGSSTLLGAGLATVANVSLTAQVADIAATNLATVAGLYRVSYSLQDTTADITAGAVVLTISYTDGAGSTTSTATQVLTGLGRQSGSVYIQLASGNLTYATTHTGLFGTATYALYISTERLK